MAFSAPPRPGFASVAQPGRGRVANPPGYSHDKIEGVAALNGGREIVISNDSDFGLADFEGTGANNASPPWNLLEKFSPVTRQEHNGEYLAINMNRVNPTTGVQPANTSTGTVTINVTGN